MTLTPLEIVALLLTVTSGVGWLNQRFLRLPSSVGLLSVGLVAALALFAAEHLGSAPRDVDGLAALVARFDFSGVLMGFLLAYLLFAGALHTDSSELMRFPLSIGALSTVGVLVSTLVVAAGLWGAARLLRVDLPFAWAAVFGALISPTDPVAVLAAFRGDDRTQDVRSLMQGESLFNDGVGVVVFGAALSIAGGHAPGAPQLLVQLAAQVGGGVLLGGVAAGLVLLLMRGIDNYSVECGLSLALATGAYALAARLHVSGPIAVVVAGLVIGNPGVRVAMSERSRRYVMGFWELVDDNLNGVLFLLLGLEVIAALRTADPGLRLCLAAILLVALGRVAATGPTLVRLVAAGALPARQAPVVIWGGLRGGISVALALSLPESRYKAPIVACTCAVVIFSVLVQGLTFNTLANWAARPRAIEGEGGS